MRCLTFLKGVGARLTMPPYTIDDGPGHLIAGNRGYISGWDPLSLRAQAASIADSFIQSGSAINLSLV